MNYKWEGITGCPFGIKTFDFLIRVIRVIRVFLSTL